ncbi:tRNA dimethylallyltransferase [compost metagenome]
MKAVGVRELAAHLAGELSLDGAVAAVKQATRNYAKRQLTWFRNQQKDWPRHAGFA